VRHDLEVCADASDLASLGAAFVTRLASESVRLRGAFTMAVSGGHTPWAMFAELAAASFAWEATTIFQVDERVAPDGDHDRNLTHLRACLEGLPVRVVAMRVNDADVEMAAAHYATQLPERFDLVHLGLGPDGHTASLVPGDAVLDVEDRLVAVTQPYQGHRRMTLTFPAIARADQLLWLVSGADKRAALQRLLDGDVSIPAARVTARASLVIADAAAR